MPLYHYKHDSCGMDQRFFLEENVNTKIIACYRCGRNVMARQVRDPKMYIGEADGVKGVMQRESIKRKKHGDGQS